MGSSSLMNTMIVGTRDEVFLALKIADLTKERRLKYRP